MTNVKTIREDINKLKKSCIDELHKQEIISYSLNKIDDFCDYIDNGTVLDEHIGYVIKLLQNYLDQVYKNKASERY